MSTIRIGCIVEGRGDDKAVPVVVRRVGLIEAPEHTVIVDTFVRRDRGKLVQQKLLMTDIEFTARKLDGDGGILVVYDADDDCPARLGPTMQTWAQSARPDVPIAVVLAMREFESWFMAAAESLGGRLSFPSKLEPHPEPEKVRDAKGWLTSRMPRPKSYSASVDQPELARHFDLGLARTRSDSFDKCYREITRLLRALTSSG